MLIMFSKEILVKNKIPVHHLKKKDFLFREDQKSTHLHYLLEGEITIYNTDSEGKEFLISKVIDQHFLGEPPFLLGERYPANAIITSDSAEIFSFSPDLFQKFMVEHPDMLLQFTKEIARKAYEKTLKLKSIAHLNPCERIINFLKIHKRSIGIELEDKILIDVTRKEMANSTGLAVETVIRTVKKMEKDGKLELINHKIHY